MTFYCKTAHCALYYMALFGTFPNNISLSVCTGYANKMKADLYVVSRVY